MVISGTPVTARGLSANPAIVARRCEAGQRDAERRAVARIVEVADRKSEVIERGHGAAVLGLKSCQKLRQG